MAAPIANQGMPIAQARGTINLASGHVFPDDLAIPVIFPDGMIRLVAYQIVPIVQLTRHAGVAMWIRMIHLEGNFLVDHPMMVHFDDTSRTTFSHHGQAICQPLKRMYLNSFSLIAVHR